MEQLQQQLAEAHGDNAGLLARLQEWGVASQRGSKASTPRFAPSPPAEHEERQVGDCLAYLHTVAALLPPYNLDLPPLLVEGPRWAGHTWLANLTLTQPQSFLTACPCVACMPHTMRVLLEFTHTPFLRIDSCSVQTNIYVWLHSCKGKPATGIYMG